jgi:predicted TIM-barrel fold metal-dependent hydrolase
MTQTFALPTNQAWLDLALEEALEPDLPIIDPHHHLWDGRSERQQSRYLLDEVLADTGAGHKVAATVFIECGSMFKADGPEALRPVGEVEFVNGTAAMSASGAYGDTRIAAGIIGTADLRLGDAVQDVLDASIAAGGGRYRGIRVACARDDDPAVPGHRTNPPPHLFELPDFRAGFRHLAPRNLSFEVWCYHRQIPDATSLARAFPGTTLVLNHFGGPMGVGSYADKPDEVFAEWRGYIDDLARCPNVVAKLGGIAMEVNGYGWHLNERPPSSEELMEATRRYYEYTIERFTPQRCMFESNFPVDKLSASYVTVWNSFKRLTHGYSASDRAALFHDTAKRVYRL